MSVEDNVDIIELVGQITAVISELDTLNNNECEDENGVNMKIGDTLTLGDETVCDVVEDKGANCHGCVFEHNDEDDEICRQINCMDGFILKAREDSLNADDINPSYYKDMNVEVMDIVEFIVNHPNNKDLSNMEAICMYAELKYRLRAGLKKEDYKDDMEKALNYRKWRK